MLFIDKLLDYVVVDLRSWLESSYFNKQRGRLSHELVHHAKALVSLFWN